MKTIVRSMTAGAVICFLISTSTSAMETPPVIQNETLQVEFSQASGSFRLLARATQSAFVTNGKLSAEGGLAKLTKVSDPTFGRGQAIEVSYPDGNRDAIMLFPKLPFVLFRASRHNNGPTATVTRKLQTLSAAVTLGRPAAELTTLGTGGLLAPDKNPGSYVWLAVADPESRRGVVGGWLTQERGSGVVFSKVENNQVQLTTQIDYGRLRLAPRKSETLETFALGFFEDARLGLEAWAGAVARIYRIKLPTQPAGYCTWYSRPYGRASDETHLAEQTAFAAKHLAPFGFSVMQIDDGWQAGISTNGPQRNFTTHAAKGPYPGGMKAAADNIKAHGLVPGIWFMPFAGTYYDPFFKEHQDWFVKRENGEPFETAWGGTCLDMTHPGARAYLRDNIRRIGHEWGYQYFKTDGLWTGTGARQVYVNSGYRDDNLGESVLHNPEKTNIEAYRDGLKLIRETAGKNTFILGCCTPQNMRSYGAAFGLVDAMRIGPDNGTAWKSLLRGPTFGTRQYFLHGRVWYNDPDPVYVRASLPLAQSQAICSWVTLSGQLNLSSEWMPELPADRLDLLKHTLPSHGLLPRPADLFEDPLPRLWLLTDNRRSPRRDVVGVFNWNDQEQTFDYPLSRLGLADNVEYVAFDYWQNSLAPLIQGRLQLSVPPQSCRILAVRPRLDRPQLLSTSRHITQGIVDVREEKWIAADKVLRGRSQLVGNDPYELRVALPVSGPGWSVKAVAISARDRAAGVKTTVKETDGLVRVTLESPASREVSWSVRFAK